MEVLKEDLIAFINSALIEDVREGDHTSNSTIPANAMGKARLLVKDNGIVAGVELAELIFKTVDPELKVEVLIKDGEPIEYGQVVLYVEGRDRSILTAERLVLNCMQRMSGIATLTHEWDSRLIGSKTKLLDTRKTTPNFRVCEKWAVAIGGGINHRYGLYDMIMLKDNHIDYNGSITNAVKMAKEYVKTTKKKLKIEVETRNLEEVKETIAANVDRIMLDNMDVEMMRKAVQLINGSCESEASGGITRDQLKEIATTGVTYISAGALTHSAENIDLSLKAVKQLELFS